jgi:uncharacterized membrane protein SirB2
MHYIELLTLHRYLVSASVALFIARSAGVGMMQAWPNKMFTRKISVFIDTLLLLAGVSLWVLMNHNPLNEKWLSLKLMLLPCYIVLGSYALKHGKTRQARAIFAVLALICVGCMALLAHDKNSIFTVQQTP